MILAVFWEESLVIFIFFNTDTSVAILTFSFINYIILLLMMKPQMVRGVRHVHNFLYNQISFYEILTANNEIHF